MQKLHTAKETAALLGYSYNYFQILKRKDSSLIPKPIRLSSRKEYWREVDIEKFIDQKEAVNFIAE